MTRVPKSLLSLLDPDASTAVVLPSGWRDTGRRTAVAHERAPYAPSPLSAITTVPVWETWLRAAGATPPRLFAFGDAELKPLREAVAALVDAAHALTLAHPTEAAAWHVQRAIDRLTQPRAEPAPPAEEHDA